MQAQETANIPAGNGISPLRVKLVKMLAAHPLGRSILNAYYLRLGPAKRQKFHGDFAKIFRDGEFKGQGGQWKVLFADKEVLMPLSADDFWLDWDTAVSIVGHDIEVKQTYKALVSSPADKPDLFLDIGANYGTHSLLFLAYGIPAITFEPNSSCHTFLKKACALNQLTPRIEHLALGDGPGHVELVYPKRETWLGSTHSETIKGLESSGDLIVEKVLQKSLDEFLPELRNRKVLIKIDTEGNELAVLRGAKSVLKDVQPRIIFESRGAKERQALFEFFETVGYSVYALPWSPASAAQPLGLGELIAHTEENFLASPTPA